MNGVALCAGCGGLELGLRIALGERYRCVCVVEGEAYAAALLATRMAEGALDACPIWDDVRSFDGAAWRGCVDIVSAGIPCFVAGTMVLSYEGYRPIESLAVGDLVLTHKGRWRPITSVMVRESASLRRISAGGVPSVVTTDEHPFYARSCEKAWDNDQRRYVRSFGELEWVEAAGLRAGEGGHYLSQVLPDEDGAYDGFSEAKWWVVGRYLADGWRVNRPKRKPTGRGILHRPISDEPRGKVVICCHKKEAAELKERIVAAGLHPIEVAERTVVKFHISNVEFWRFLEPFGTYAHGKTLPGFVFELPRRFAAALLEGYLSGDGSERQSGERRATTVSKQLALGIALLAQRVYGIVAGITRHSMEPSTIIEGRIVNQRDFYAVSICERNRSAFVDGRYGHKLVRKNEPAGVGRVHNISVEEDESYVADGAVVHNCQGNSIAGKRQLERDPRNLWPDARRILRETGARHFFLENVPGLLIPNRGEGLAAPIVGILAELAEDGFDAEWGVFSAAEVGASHKRERVFVLAHRREQGHAKRAGKRRDDGAELTATERGGGALANAEREPGSPELRPGSRGRKRKPSTQEPVPSGSCRSSGVLDDAASGRERQRLRQQATPAARAQSRVEGPGVAVADSAPSDCTCKRQLGDDVPRQASEAAFAPGPGEPRWGDIIAACPWLAPAVKPGFHGMVDGHAFLVDGHRSHRLRAIGNAVVARTAALAFTILARRLGGIVTASA